MCGFIWSLLWLGTGCSVRSKPVLAPQVAAHLTAQQEPHAAVDLHQHLDCMGFRNGPDNQPFILLPIKSVGAMQALLARGYFVLIIWADPGSGSAYTVAYFNPYTQQSMAVVAAFEDATVNLSTPFALSQMPGQYGILPQGMFLIYNVVVSPQAHLYKSCPTQADASKQISQ